MSIRRRQAQWNMLILALWAMSVCPEAARAQHEEHPISPSGKQSGQASDHRMADVDNAIPGHQMGRHGSGTAWQPDASPMWMIHWNLDNKQGRQRENDMGVHEGMDHQAHAASDAGTNNAKAWKAMLMGNAFLDYVDQSGPKGSSRLISQNWLMGMAHRTTRDSDLSLRLMFSLEPATVGNRGVPQIFQTGEGLINSQHPHDLTMEVAAQYLRRIDRRLAWSLYIAPVGEPALGPVAYPHRASAMENPQTPLAHHIQDSSHITYGVITGGIQRNRWKLEGSWFNAIEPDQERWSPDPLRLNSPSVRLWCNPGPNWSMQLSRGWLKAPERNEPGNIRRTTASLAYARPLQRGFYTASLIWGRNDPESHHGGDRTSDDSFLLEGIYHWADKNYLFGRIERLDREGLFVSGPLAEKVFTINAFTIGYSRDISRVGDWDVAVGSSITLHSIPSELKGFYGDAPTGTHFFLRLRPRKM